MALDGLGPDDIEVDGVMSQPSDPMPCERKCSRVFAPIAFSVRKTFWKKFLGNGVASVASVASVVFIKKFPLHLLHCESDARDFPSARNKNPQKNL